MTITPAPPSRLAALRYRDFRLLWLGLLVSITGSQMQLTAVNWHIYQLLRGERYQFSLLGLNLDLSAEALGLGALGLVRVLPIILFGLVGGMLADTYDRRKLMMVTRTLAAVLAGILALVTLTGQETIPAIYLLTSALAATIAFDNPARQALVPNLIPREHLANAVSLNTLMFQFATILGPYFAGQLIAVSNIGLVYAINAGAFIVAVIALLLMHYRSETPAATGNLGWGAMLEGLRFTYRSRIIWGTMLLDFFATFFSSARTMLPIMAGTVLDVGPVGYGLLTAAEPVGAVIAGSFLALRREINRQGVVLLVSVVIYGIATALFGLSTNFALSFFFMMLVGAGDTVSAVIRGTARQMLTPDHLRGRMTGVNMIFFMGGPQLGELEAGLVAAAVGAPISIFLGGVATVLLTGWVAWKYAGLRTYTRQTEVVIG